MTRAVLIAMLVAAEALAPSGASAALPHSPDRGVTVRAGVPGSSPMPRPHGVPCDGNNHLADNYMDNWWMGGPMVGISWFPAASADIGHLEVFTGELVATDYLAIWSDDGGAPSRPLAPLGWTLGFPIDMPDTWYGADLVSPVSVTAGAKYWFVFDPVGNEQCGITGDPADIQQEYWSTSVGTVSGGAVWDNGPYSDTDHRWKFRMRCVSGCESPAFSIADAADVSACNDGITLAWSPAGFPGAGNGTYHVYRSLLGFADALAQPPVATDVRATAWIDIDTVAGSNYWYVVQAESLDFPACGSGPLVMGSTDEVNIGPVADDADVTPPAVDVGSALRAIGYGFASVDFAWTLAPPPGPGEQYVVFRSDDRPDTGFTLADTTTLNSWTDPAVPPRAEPVHVWFYDVRVADDCGNASQD